MLSGAPTLPAEFATPSALTVDLQVILQVQMAKYLCTCFVSGIASKFDQERCHISCQEEHIEQ